MGKGTARALIRLQRYYKLFFNGVQTCFSNDYSLSSTLCLFGVFVFVSVAYVQYQVSDFAMNEHVSVHCPTCSSIYCPTADFISAVTPYDVLILVSYLYGDVSVPIVQSRL